MGTYTADTLPQATLKGFRKETQDLILAGLAAGWTLQDASRGTVTLRPYLPNITPIHLSRSSRNNSGPLQQLYRKIAKGGDPVRLISIGFSTDQLSFIDSRTVWNKLLDEFQTRLSPATAITLRSMTQEQFSVITAEFGAEGITFDTYEKLLDAVVQRHAQKGVQVAVKKDAKTAIQQVAEAPKKEPRRLVSTHPFMAKGSAGSPTSPGKVYESPVVLEQRWSDDTVNYRCRLCPHESNYPVGIVSHWKKHTNAGEVPIVGTRAGGTAVMIADPTYIDLETRQRSAHEEAEHEYSPREDRVAALASTLLQALQAAVGEDPEVVAYSLAREALNWQHAQQGNGVPREPQTAEEMLSAIRDMVDRGEYARMRQAALEAEQAADVAQERAERAESRNGKLLGDLKSLRDLISSVGGDDD